MAASASAATVTRYQASLRSPHNALHSSSIHILDECRALWGERILDECRALWGERSEAWYRVTAAVDAEQPKRVYVDYL